MCWRTVPQTESSDKMKLTAEGGKPQTVIQVSKGVGSGDVSTSCEGQVLVSGAPPGGDRRLAPRLPPVPGVDIDLLGVNRRELVGGPPGFSRTLLDKDEFMFSLRS